MVSFSWRQWWFGLGQSAPIRRAKRSGSTRPMEVEVLEERQVPAPIVGPVNVLVTGFGDSATISPLVHRPGLPANYFSVPNLRSAIVDVNAIAAPTGRPNVIMLRNGMISLTQGQLEIDLTDTVADPETSLLIENANGGSNRTIIDATHNNDRIFQVDSASIVTMTNLKLQNGSAQSDAFEPTVGGAIFDEGTLTLNNDIIYKNQAIGSGGGEGNLAQEGLGGGVFVAYDGTLTVNKTTFDHNLAEGGSGYGGNDTFESGTHQGAGAEGGGLYIEGVGLVGGFVNITASTFSNNVALGGSAELNSPNDDSYGGGFAYGGGIATSTEDEGEVVTIVNSTFANNVAAGGPGIVVTDGPIKHQPADTFTVNDFSGSAYGGGISVSVHGGYTVKLVNDTIALNQVFGGESSGTNHGAGVANLNVDENTIDIVNTIVAEDKTTVPETTPYFDDVGGKNPDDSTPYFDSFGHNFIGADNGTNDSFDMPGDRTGTADAPLNPRFTGSVNFTGFVGTLQFNGGPTQTLALAANSPCINHGDNSFGGLVAPPPTDQRGFKRIVGPFVDIGAYEVQLPVNGLGRDLLLDIIESMNGNNNNTTPPQTPPTPPG